MPTSVHLAVDMRDRVQFLEAGCLLFLYSLVLLM